VLATRLYRLGWHPLWVDEIYSYNVSRLGFRGIIENSFYEPHLPPFYFLLRLATGFGGPVTEARVRLVSALAGAITIMVLGFALTRIAGTKGAIPGLIFLLLSPTLMFYSQEARAYMLAVLWVPISTVLVYRLSKPEQADSRTWFAWFLVSLLGQFSAFSYFFVLAVQGLFLLWVHRLRKALVASLLGLAILSAPLLSFLAPQFGNRIFDNSAPALTLDWVLRTLLSASAARYPTTTLGNLMLLAFFLAACFGALRLAEKKERFLLYLIAQWLFPLAGFFLVGGPLFGIRLPNFQSRQFLVLFPAIFLWCMAGLDWIIRKNRAAPGMVIAMAAAAIFTAGSVSGLEQYWQAPKSPEGSLILALRPNLRPGDAVISLNLSINHAIDFYLPEVKTVYAFPQLVDGDLYFDDNHFFLGVNLQPEPQYGLEAIKTHDRAWLLYIPGRLPEVEETLQAGCLAETGPAAPPFEALLLYDCH